MAALSGIPSAHAAGSAGGPPVLAPDAPVVVAAVEGRGGPHAEEGRVVQLGLPDPSRHGVGTPARATAEWMTAWRQRAWDRMRLWTTPLPRRPVSASALRTQFWVARLDGWSLRDVAADGARARAVVLAAVHPALRLRVRRVTLTLPLRRTSGVWQVQAQDVLGPVAGAMA